MDQPEFFGFFGQLAENALNSNLSSVHLSVDRGEFSTLKAGVLNRFFGFTCLLRESGKIIEHRDWTYVLDLIAKVEVGEYGPRTPDEELADEIVNRKCER